MLYTATFTLHRNHWNALFYLNSRIPLSVPVFEKDKKSHWRCILPLFLLRWHHASPTKRACDVPIPQPFLQACFMEKMAACKVIYLRVRFKLCQTNGALLFGASWFAHRVEPDCRGPATKFLHVGLWGTSAALIEIWSGFIGIFFPRCYMNSNNMEGWKDHVADNRDGYDCVHKDYA